MSTRYFCDVCKLETRNRNELQQITRDYRDGKTELRCDVCKPCTDKMFKPVKEWHSTVRLELKLVEEENDD